MTTRPGRAQAPESHATGPGRPRARRRAPLLRHVYGGLLRGLRLRQGRTLAEVANEAGISVAYLSEVERGLKEPSSEVLDAVCWALGSSITSLIGAAHRQLLDLTTPVEHTRAATASASATSAGSSAGAFALAA